MARERSWWWRAALGGLGIVLCAPLWAATDAERIGTLEQELARSQALIRSLLDRMAELERRTGAAAPAPAVPAAPPAPEHAGDPIAAGGVPVHGFIDVGAGWSTARDPVRLRGFNAGSLDLYLTPQIGPRVKSLIELVLEFDEEGKSFDVERMQIGYTLDDALTLWGGRFHTPFGVWNTLFHHGANLQTSISRPRLVEFEDRGGLIPAHSIGLWASGKRPLGGSGHRATYDLYVANGPSIRDRRLDPNLFTDDNVHKLVGFNGGWESATGGSGLRVGLHGFETRVASYAAGDRLIATTAVHALGAYLAYESRDWESYGEFYSFRNKDMDSGRRFRSVAGYLHLGRAFGDWTPYLRYERNVLDREDNYFRSQAPGRSATYLLGGLRWSLEPNAALKLELRAARDEAATLLDGNGLPVDVEAARYRRLLLEYSIAF